MPVRYLRPLVLSLVFAAGAAAQVQVSGVVQDTSGTPLPGATVVLLNPADSVLVSFAATRADGVFQLRRVRSGDYLLRATFVGYQTTTQEVTVAQDDLDVGAITMEGSSDELGELIVRSDRVPIVLKQDTLEYDAAAFGAPQGAVVEDLLRRLPGVEVEEDGSITAQGERVRNVLVDGKEFFSDDPTVATRNLPADAVDRVQVYDKESETAEFTGVADGNEERTINLELKEDRRTGMFGNISGGLGGVPGTATDGPASPDALLFDSRASINRFSPTTQLSFIANLNNVNRESFSVGDYFQFMGPTRMAGGGVVFRIGGDGIPVGDDLGDGFATTLSGGLNFNRDFGSRTKLRSSYFLHRLDKDRVHEIRREQFFGAGLASRLDEDGTAEDRRMLHRLNVSLEREFAEGHDLTFRSGLRYADSDQVAMTNRATLGLEGELENTSAATTSQLGADAGGDATLTYRRRFASRRSFVAEAKADLGLRDLDGDLDATTRLYDRGDLLSTEEIAQLEALTGDQRTLSGSLLFTQPFGTTDALQVRAEVRQTGEDQNRDVFDTLGGGRSRIDSLSTSFDRIYRYAVGGLTYRRNKEPFNLSAGLQLQLTDLAGTLSNVDGDIGNQYLRVLPSATIGYAISDSRNVELNYSTATREPSLRELQPVADTRDPLNTYIGNPDLLPAYTHSVNARYLSFDAFTSTNLFAFVNASYSPTAISTERTVDAQLRQSTRPYNSSGTWSLSGTANLGTLVKSLRSRINVSVSPYFSRGIEVVNGQENLSSLFRTSLDLRIQNRDNEKVDARLGTRLSYNTNAYSLNPELDRDYLNRTFYADLGWTPTEEWELRTEFDLNLYADAVIGGGSEVRSVPLWEASLSRTLMSGKTRVELVAKDLLDRNLGVDYSSTASYVQESRVNSLGRYVLLRLVYNLGSQGGRGGLFGR